MGHKALGRYVALISLLFVIGCNKTNTSTESPNAAPNSDAGNVPSSSNSNANYNNAGSPNGQQDSGAPSAPLFAPKPIVIRAGTGIEVTVDQMVSSKDSNPGDRFEASLAEPVVVGERVILPKGTRAVGKVTGAKSACRFKWNAEISVTLTSVTVDGKKYEVNASEVTESGKGRGKRTAIGAGGGAVVGGLIGALAGGGKGAAIGAGAGAGAGTAGTALTGNRDVEIRPETRLRFKLISSLEVRKN
jgi:uncharacterized protein YcfJ